MLRNDQVAAELERLAELLSNQHASPWRVRAYRRAAARVRGMAQPVAELLESGGEAALVELPDIGRSIAAAIEELVHTGRLRFRERLDGQLEPEDELSKVPGVGKRLAHRAHDELGVETLEELEAAAYDGRLAHVEGFGEHRVRAVRDGVTSLLDHSARGPARPRRPSAPPPPVETLLSIDARYRRLASSGRLRTIAPRRLNPGGVAWLPVMHHEQDGYTFHVFFSNTATAHRLGRTKDWVVVYFERDGLEGQCTVVTEFRGIDEGLRVVRGREWECERYYDEHPPSEGGELPLDWQMGEDLEPTG
jgi:DNA polymerase (family 10)